MASEDLLPYLEYVHSEQRLYSLKESKLTYTGKPEDNRLKLIQPDEERQVCCNINKKLVRTKYSRLLWMVLHGTFPARDQVVLHKDLDEDNYSINNLSLITRQQYRLLTENIRNLAGELRIVPHKQDVFSYVLEYRKNGLVVRKVIHDIGIAKRRLARLQLLASKIVASFTVSK